ncbi:hypothetical protein VTO73DRAFT_2553 [Trametes versicolor]
MAPIRYSDRVVYQICIHGVESFMASKLIEDVLQRMVDTGAKVTRFSRTLISNYLKQLVRQRLLIRGPGEELGLNAKFREAVSRLPRDPMFTEHSLLKEKELIKLKVHRAKNTTKKELYDENIELQEKLEKTVARLNDVIKDLTTAQGERDAAMKQLDKALEELRGLRRSATPRPSTPPPGAQDDPMDVDMDENAQANIASTSAQSSRDVLQRVPTVPDNSILPETPNRHPSTHSLLTPPPTQKPNRRRLARTSVSLSYRDFEEQPEGHPMDTSGSQAHAGPSEASGSHTQHQGITTSAAGVAGTGEGPIQALGVPPVEPPAVAVPMSASGRPVTFGDFRQMFDLFEEQQTQKDRATSLQQLIRLYFIYISSPVLNPLVLTLINARLCLASCASRTRIKKLQKEESSTARFAHIIRHLERKVAEAVVDMLDSADQAQAQTAASPGSPKTEPSLMLNTISHKHVAWLNTLPGIKEPAFIDSARNAHGSIVAREKRFPSHQRLWKACQDRGLRICNYINGLMDGQTYDIRHARVC